LSDQLFKEIAQDAKELIDRSFVGKDTVTARVLNAFRRMRDKLNSLGFLDYRCFAIVDEIDKILGSMPKSGPYNGSAYHALFSLGLLLSDPDKVKAHGSGLSQSSFPGNDQDIDGQLLTIDDAITESDDVAEAWFTESTLFMLDDYSVTQYIEEDQDCDKDEDYKSPQLQAQLNVPVLTKLDAANAIVFNGAVQRPVLDQDESSVDQQIPAALQSSDMWF
jgi:hypothetical protein